MPRILIVDDDRALCALLAEYLQREGFVVDIARRGYRAGAVARAGERPELLILDVMMPGRDGLDTLRELRLQHRLPVIMLSARGEPVDRVIGLELGADDYLSKPCLPRELLARVRAHCAAMHRPPPPTSRSARCGCSRVTAAPSWTAGADPDRRGIQLLLALAQHAGVLVDKASLTRLALGRELEKFDRSIDVHVSRLRHKLAEASATRRGSNRCAARVTC